MYAKENVKRSEEITNILFGVQKWAQEIYETLLNRNVMQVITNLCNVCIN